MRMLRALCELGVFIGRLWPLKSKDSNSAATGGTTAPIGGPTGIAANGGSPAGGAMTVVLKCQRVVKWPVVHRAAGWQR